MKRLAGRVALVTGAAQGVGLATALELAQRGYALVLVDVQPLDAALAIVRAAGAGAGTGAVSSAQGDVADEPFVVQLAARVAREAGPLDVLVNNAGVSLIVKAEETTLAQWQRVLQVNLQGPFLMSRELGRQMLERGGGSIVNVASIAATAGIAHRAAYNASKHGLLGLTRTLAAEWGGRGVRVNAVCPGWIKTEMDQADQGSGHYGDADIIDRVPLARFARPEDVARAIAFLADGEQSGFITGVALPVDGGWTADASWESLRIGTRA